MSKVKTDDTHEKPAAKRKPSRSVAHYNAVLIEDLQSQFKLVIEHVEGFRDSIRQEMAEGFRQVHERLNVHEQYLKVNEKRWQDNEKRWQDNDKRWQDNEKRWQDNEKRWQDNEKHWQDNEAWQREAMACLVRIENKVDNHEDRITTLEQRAFPPLYPSKHN